MKEWKSISEITAYLVILLKQTLIDNLLFRAYL